MAVGANQAIQANGRPVVELHPFLFVFGINIDHHRRDLLLVVFVVSVTDCGRRFAHRQDFESVVEGTTDRSVGFVHCFVSIGGV